MLIFTNLRDKYHEHKDTIKFCLAFGLPVLLFIVGFIATGSSEHGYSLLPWHFIPALVSPAGLNIFRIIFLLAIFGFVAYSIRSQRYSGMKKDDRNFYFNNKGTYGTAEFMEHSRMREKFDCVPESRVTEAEGNVMAIKDGLCISRPENSHHNRNCAAFGAAGSMKSRAIIRNSIIGCMRRGESMVITDPKGGATRSQLKRLGVEPKISGMKGAA